MAVSETNRIRYRAVIIGRQVKQILMAVPGHVIPKRWLFRWLFLAPDGQVHRAGEIVLADLREFAGMPNTPFNPDPIIMARRVGRQEVVQRIYNYLNLDENAVRKLMELDDGLD